jgi:hypothetical protein
MWKFKSVGKMWKLNYRLCVFGGSMGNRRIVLWKPSRPSMCGGVTGRYLSQLPACLIYPFSAIASMSYLSFTIVTGRYRRVFRRRRHLRANPKPILAQHLAIAISIKVKNIVTL